MDDATAAPPVTPKKRERGERDYKAEWAKRKAREAARNPKRDYKAERARRKAAGTLPTNKSRAKPRSELKHPNKAWSPEHRRKFIATRKRLFQEKKKAHAGGTAWTPERRKKFMATMKQKAKAAANGTGPRIGRPRKDARPPDVWGMRPDGQEGWLTPILQQRWVYVPKPG